MAAKITADPSTRIFTVTEAPDVNGFVVLDVVADIYSPLKDDWHSDPTLQLLRFPLSPDGGRQKSPTEFIGKNVFVANGDGWRFRPYDADHELQLIGNLFPIAVTTALWLPRAGRTITIQGERSSLSSLLTASGDGFGAADRTKLDRVEKVTFSKL